MNAVSRAGRRANGRTKKWGMGGMGHSLRFGKFMQILCFVRDAMFCVVMFAMFTHNMTQQRIKCAVP